MHRTAVAVLVSSLLCLGAGCVHVSDALRRELDRGLVQDAARCVESPDPGACIGVRAGVGAVRTLIDAAVNAMKAAATTGSEADTSPAAKRKALRELRAAEAAVCAEDREACR